MKKKWISYEKDYKKSIELVEEMGLPAIFGPLLYNRNIETVQEGNHYLFGKYEDIEDSFLMKDMTEAVDRIVKAIENSESIVIYGDYDVDGTVSTSLLYSVIKSLGGNVDYYIPNRFEEGYGLNDEAVKMISERGTNLIVTVDCGISSIDSVDFANSLGLNLVITDHHQCGEILPKAMAIVNPHRIDCKSAFKDLAGCGVALKLAKSLGERMGKPGIEKKYLDLAAIGTVADVVPLTGENRIIVKEGLSQIRSSENIGIQAMLTVCELLDKPINSYTIGFIIGPRMNAAGRLDSALEVVKLLTTEDNEEAMQIAKKLDSDNKERQKIEKDILEKAIEIIENNGMAENSRVLVVDGEGWHSGVIGIVASRLVEKYYLPTLIISRSGDEAKGSARSLSGFNLFDALSKIPECFEKFGGHEMAAGFSLKSDKIQELREKLNIVAEEVTDGKPFIPEIQVDYKLSGQELSRVTHDKLKLLEPYGMKNPAPVFVCRKMKVISFKKIGVDGKHLSLNLFDSEKSVAAIAFQMGELFDQLKINCEIDILCSLEINSWNGFDKLQLNIKDIKI